MKRYLAGLAAIVFAAGLTVLPAAAIDAEPGGGVIGGAAVTIGQATTDANDQMIDRCECDGGPLKAIVVASEGGGEQTVQIDRLVGSAARTSDGVEIGPVINVTNKGAAIVLTVRVDDGVLGTVERIALRRTAFYWTGNAVVIETNLGDLRSSINSAVGGAGA